VRCCINRESSNWETTVRPHRIEGVQNWCLGTLLYLGHIGVLPEPSQERVELERVRRKDWPLPIDKRTYFEVMQYLCFAIAAP
jgi:hypothetical protein